MVSFRIIFLVAAILASTISVNASVYPGALNIAKHFLERAVILPNGPYTFLNLATQRYLYFTKKNNVINPASAGSHNHPGTYTTFNVKVRGAKNSTIEFTNGSHKCLSAAWYQGQDNTAVFYACRPGWSKRSSDDVVAEDTALEERDASPADEEFLDDDYENLDEFQKRDVEVRQDKMEWVFIPIKWRKNTYLIVSTAHMWNMYPVCLFSTRSPNADETGMTLRNCSTRADHRFFWIIEKH